MTDTENIFKKLGPKPSISEENGLHHNTMDFAKKVSDL